MRLVAIRLHPGQDLYYELEEFIQRNQIEAACVLTCVGSLKRASLRFADQLHGTILGNGDKAARFEIVSLNGVMSIHGSHYHLSISDEQGRTIGGHLLQGSIIYTTAEIVLAIMDGTIFRREFDEQSGYPELVIE